MATIDILNLIKLGDLSEEQASILKKRLIARKRELAAAMQKVDQGLNALEQMRKSKKSAKRSTAKRSGNR
jgi:hypothetical protein